MSEPVCERKEWSCIVTCTTTLYLDWYLMTHKKNENERYVNIIIANNTFDTIIEEGIKKIN